MWMRDFPFLPLFGLLGCAACSIEVSPIGLEPLLKDAGDSPPDSVSQAGDDDSKGAGVDAEDPELEAVPPAKVTPEQAPVIADAGKERPETKRSDCDPALRLLVRDFAQTHVDFDKTTGTEPVQTGFVDAALSSDRKPVFADPQMGGLGAFGRPAQPGWRAASPQAFDEWFHTVAGVNVLLEKSLEFDEQTKGTFVYDSAAYFPIDGEGLSDGPASISLPLLGSFGPSDDHNHLFTTEAHARFTYRGGERLLLRGDDDLWLFINGTLAIDLGGTHAMAEGTVDLDARAKELGLVVGKSYPLDLFQADRNSRSSNLRIETTIDLGCIENLDLP